MSPTDTPVYSLADLADLADVTPRTVRYYIAQGLLPSPGTVGPGSRYGEGHLNRLRLVRQLQREHLPLAEIRGRLAALSDADVAGLVEMPEPAPPSGSALDYIRSIIDRTRTESDRLAPPPRYLLSMAKAVPPAAAPATSPEPQPQPDRSQWDRIGLAPDIELHVRRPLSRIQNKRVERLVTIARQLLEEESP